MKKCIAVIGKNCSGKETVFRVSKEVIENNGHAVSIVHFSDPLNETLDAVNQILLTNKKELAESISFSEFSVKNILKYKFLQKLLGGELEVQLLKTRLNQQIISEKLRVVWGQNLFARAIYDRAVGAETDFVFVDGIRRPADARMLRAIKDSLLVYVHAPLEKRHIRSCKRNDRAGDAEMSFEEFCKRDQAEPEQLIEEVAKDADIIIDNSGTEDELKRKVRQILLIGKLGLAV